MKDLQYLLYSIFFSALVGVGLGVIGVAVFSFTLWEWTYDWMLLRGVASGTLVLGVLLAYCVKGDLEKEKAAKEKAKKKKKTIIR